MSSLENEKGIPPAYHSDSEVGVVEPDSKNFYAVPDERKSHFDEMRALSPEEFKEIEVKVIKKMDRTIIPWITYVPCHPPEPTFATDTRSLLYLMSFLDRVNVGAAKLVGLTTELKLDSLQYSNVSMSQWRFLSSQSGTHTPRSLLRFLCRF